MLTQKELVKARADFSPPESSEARSLVPKMHQTKIDVFKKQFPWVMTYVEKEPLSRVYVSRVEPEILNYDIESYTYYSDCDPFVERIYLLDKSGVVVTTDIMEPYTYREPNFFGLPYGKRVAGLRPKVISGKVHSKSTVAETLDALGDHAKRVCFILSYYRVTQAAILYKSPRGISVGDWVEQQLMAERIKLKAETDAIDAEAAHLM